MTTNRQKSPTWYRVIAQGLNLRSRPDANSARILILAESQKVKKISEVMDSPKWWRVSAIVGDTTIEGFVAHRYLAPLESGQPEKTSGPTIPVRQLRVFLCHSSGDKHLVRDLYSRLRGENVDPWLDEEKILPGQDWNSEIQEAVRVSDVIVVCLSKSSVNKEGYVQKEIRQALNAAEEKPEGTIFIIPARLEDCEVPRRLRQWEWVDLFAEQGFERLLAALRLRAATIED